MAVSLVSPLWMRAAVALFGLFNEAQFQAIPDINRPPRDVIATVTDYSFEIARPARAMSRWGAKFSAGWNDDFLYGDVGFGLH
jgi:hypothetical protein